MEPVSQGACDCHAIYFNLEQSPHLSSFFLLIDVLDLSIISS
jgi:hypothetical protein